MNKIIGPKVYPVSCIKLHTMDFFILPMLVIYTIHYFSATGWYGVGHKQHWTNTILVVVILLESETEDKRQS